MQGAKCRLPVLGAPPLSVSAGLTAFSSHVWTHTVPNNPTLELLGSNGLGSLPFCLPALCLGVYRLVWRFVVEQGRPTYATRPCSTWSSACWPQTPASLRSSTPPCRASQSALAAAFLCHFLYLATFFWMLAQA